MTAPVPSLAVAYRDVRAQDLGLHLGLPPQPPIADRIVARGPWTLHLRILAASHQVLVSYDGEDVCSETVACIDTGTTEFGPLPRSRRRRLDAVDHEFTSTVHTMPTADFESRVHALVTELDQDEGALCATFPGHDHASTCLQARFGVGPAVSWRSWHSYPQTDEIVETESRVDLARRLPTTPRGRD